MSIKINERLWKYLINLQQLRYSNDGSAHFWDVYVEALVAICEATVGIVWIRNKERGNKQPLAVFPKKEERLYIHHLMEKAESMMQDLEKKIIILEEKNDIFLTLRLVTPWENETVGATFLFKNRSKVQVLEKIKYLDLVVDVPYSYQIQKVALEAKRQVEHFANLFDFLVLLNREKRFLAAAMTFCNELAARHRCEKVSLGWLEGGYIKLQAISHTDHFNRKMEAVQRLEAVMEEALDQDTEIVLPEKGDKGIVTRDHQIFAKDYDVSYICSLPLRRDGEPIAVCTCERNSAAFSQSELRFLRLCCDQATPRLAELKHHDRWLGARLVSEIREKLALLIGYQHTWAKAVGILIAILLGFLCFGQISFRIEAPAILRTDNLVSLAAPFEGFIEKVWVRVGDEVEEKYKLLRLDQKELLLQEAALVAEKKRYQRELEKARAENNLAQMRIAEARGNQVLARLNLVRYRLSRSVISAPFKGIIVEGDLKERVGSPVKQGEVLFKIARIEGLYAELEVDERDIAFIKVPLWGEIALASRPQEKVKIQVLKVEPVAIPKGKKGNIFIVRAKFPQGYPEWWRPGMTGVAKLNIGKRSPLWIFTRRTVDFLRLRLW